MAQVHLSTAGGPCHRGRAAASPGYPVRQRPRCSGGSGQRPSGLRRSQAHPRSDQIHFGVREFPCGTGAAVPDPPAVMLHFTLTVLAQRRSGTSSADASRRRGGRRAHASPVPPSRLTWISASRGQLTPHIAVVPFRGPCVEIDQRARDPPRAATPRIGSCCSVHLLAPPPPAYSPPRRATRRRHRSAPATPELILAPARPLRPLSSALAAFYP